MNNFKQNIKEDKHIRGVQQKYGGGVQDFLLNTSDFVVKCPEEVLRKANLSIFKGNHLCYENNLVDTPDFVFINDL